jgi:CubicO group peptidase (beta-lactamase class C family)
VAQLVTAPLGMKDTGFLVDRTNANRVAAAYFNAQTGNAPSGPALMADPQTLPFGSMTLVYSPSRAFDAKAYPSAGAGMIGSAPDLLKLFEAMRKKGGEMFRNQVAGIPGLQPGTGFGFGGALVVDPVAAKTPQTAGTMYWGGVYGHTWFVDPAKKLTVLVFTNTAPDGMAGEFPDGLRDVVYATLP